MKKIWIITLLVSTLVGCAKSETKQLVCRNTRKQFGVGIEATVTYHFDAQGRAIVVEQKEYHFLGDDIKISKKDYAAGMEGGLNFGDPGISGEVKETETGVETFLKIVINELEEETRSDLEETSVFERSEIIKENEKLGWNCK